MNANLNFPSISTFSPNGGNVVPNPTPTDGDPKAEEFAAVLTGQMFKAERQGLAAQVFGGPSLQVVSLGTKLNVITTDEPLPDLPSLATFARSQGLDEIAIQALFGPTAGPKSDITISGVGQPYATKSAPGIASATPLVLFGKNSFLAVDNTTKVPESAILAPVSNIGVPRMDSRSSIGELHPVKEALAAMGASLAKTKEPVDPTQVAFDPNQAVLPATQAVLASIQAVLPPTQAVLPPTQAVLPSTQAVLPPTQAVLPPTQAVLPPTQAVLPSTQAVLPSTQAVLLSAQAVLDPRDSNSKLASRTQMANITTAITTAAPSGTAVRATERANVIEEPIGIALAALVSLGQTGTDKLAQARPDMRLNVSAEESIQDAIRLSITMPAKDSTKRTPNTAGAAETLNWSAMLAGPSANKVGVSNAWQNLHLTVPEGFDLDEQSGTLASWDQDQDPVTSPGTQQTTEGSAAKPGAAAAHALRGETSTIAAQTELRAVQQQQLADRLGEAAAHRLIAQIERGEWKMQMRLQPGKLGKIDVELTMHARGLEALFSADSALTRELIAQGSARLKDTLTQAGMTVASVTVNGDQARQSGGNPTPQHGNQAYADPRPVKAPREEPLASVETSPTRTNDRLNILA
jgi:flagellar hook-length control protein FliK